MVIVGNTVDLSESSDKGRKPKEERERFSVISFTFLIDVGSDIKVRVSSCVPRICITKAADSAHSHSLSLNLLLCSYYFNSLEAHGISAVLDFISVLGVCLRSGSGMSGMCIIG